MREVGPNFIFIDFIVPALGPRLNWIQTALQLSENITLFAIRGIHTSVIAIGTDEHVVFWGIIYVHAAQCWGQDATLRHPCLHCP
jgi:hypothetical protein